MSVTFVASFKFLVRELSFSDTASGDISINLQNVTRVFVPYHCSYLESTFFGRVIEETCRNRQSEDQQSQKERGPSAELRSFSCFRLFFETVALAGDSFLGCSLQGNVWHSPARGPVRPERKDRSQVWILGDGIEIRSQNTTSIACNENQYMPSTVKIREGYRPPYLTEESVVQPEKHRKKQPTNTRKSQPSDSYILATEEKTKL